MRINLKRKARDAGIRVTQKNHGKSSEVYPYLFRHSRATHLATELTEAAMKQYFGWTQNSDMPKTYIHLSGRDIDGEIMDMYGVEKNQEEPEKKECTRCTKTYKGEDRFCPRCGAPFNAFTAQKKDELEEAAETIARKIVDGEIDRKISEEMPEFSIRTLVQTRILTMYFPEILQKSRLFPFFLYTIRFKSFLPILLQSQFRILSVGEKFL